MKKIVLCVFVLLLCLVFNLWAGGGSQSGSARNQARTEFNPYSHEIPNWIKGGMTIDEVKAKLNVTRYENDNSLEIGYDLALGGGIWMYDGDNKYSLSDMASDNFRVYTFAFDSDNKLNVFNIAFFTDDHIELINNFNSRYGLYNRTPEERFFWIINRPTNVFYVVVSFELYDGRYHVNIGYFLVPLPN